MKMSVLAAGVLSVCAIAPVCAQETLPAVETMTCEQMMPELMVAGQTMSAQLDPEFAAEAQRMYAEQQAAMAAAGATMPAGAGLTAACAAGVPGACTGQMAQADAQNTANMAAAADNQERMAAQVGRVEDATAGIDMARMMALSERFEALGCETPQ